MELPRRRTGLEAERRQREMRTNSGMETGEEGLAEVAAVEEVEEEMAAEVKEESGVS